MNMKLWIHLTSNFSILLETKPFVGNLFEALTSKAYLPPTPPKVEVNFLFVFSYLEYTPLDNISVEDVRK